MIKVSDYIARRLYELGLRHVFMVTGGGAMHLNDAFARGSGFEVLFNHHEQACAIAAEGLFRATGQVGVVNVTTGPGGLNTLTGLMGQWTDSIPTIYVSGQVKHSTTVDCCRDIPLRQLGDQEVDIIPIVAPLTKYAKSVKDPHDVRFELEQAFHLATSGRKGPVWLDIPMDVQGAIVDETSLRPYVAVEYEPAPFDADAVAQLIQKSRRPLLVFGHGLRLAGQATRALQLAERLGIPAVVTFGGYDLVPNAHPSYAGRIGTLGTRGGNFTLQNADLVVLLGTRNNVRQISYNWENFAPHAVTVAVDVDPAELKKPTFSPSHAVQADLASFLPALEEALHSTQPKEEFRNWLRWAKARTERYSVVLPEHLRVEDRIHPYPFFEQFTQRLPEDAVVVAGNGTACVVLFQAGVVRAGQRHFWNSGCASMGYDLPAAIGAARGLKRTVWCLAGDGSLQMNLQELATVSYNRLPVKLVVLNNGGYASIRQTQTNFFGTQYGCGASSGLGFPNYRELARAYDLPYRCSSRLEETEEHQRQVQALEGPVIWEIQLTLDYAFEPKLSSRKLPDGRMVSSPLHDMAPFLSRDELAENMLSPVDDA
ncbi:MAG: thiamine pyrophosphate-binding protein [Myxococcales bacterium]